MPKYIPFLKMKQNEIQAIRELKGSVRDVIVPFFDIPRPKNSDEDEILERLRIARKNADADLVNEVFYLDNFDLDESIDLNGKPQYEAILDAFSSFDVIPVVGLYRDERHLIAALNRSKTSKMPVALRLTAEDIESFKLSYSQISDVLASLEDAGIDELHVILDLRVVSNDAEVAANTALKFIEQFEKKFNYAKLVVSGSTIPANVAQIVKAKHNVIFQRREWLVWNNIKDNDELERNWIFGDYGVVSPDYTDMELDYRIVQNIATPKVFYTFKDSFYAARGGSFKSHPSKYGQYFSIADTLVDFPHFRKKDFSFGEKYIHERSYKAVKKSTKAGSPSSWLKATLVSHITFIAEMV